MDFNLVYFYYFFLFLVDTSEKGLISLGALSVYISIKLPTSFEVSSYPQMYFE